ncbi:protein ABIL2-like isoform X1 [Gossypium australe]|uniref:Protein ABIL2-like isoform X1 n=1 Tax=Gossypium australe TaxID=47621 RepID=A0A5B6UG47_9ROSI|nr:protein ABIL2-like isoform X1 [Gossypium australe]
MKNMNSPTSVPVPQQSSHRDEVLMQQSLVFAENLKDLKNLREQLYSAAEYFEMAYTKEMQKQIVEDTLKDYAIKALVNTVDHLGSIAYKINTFLDEKINDYSVMELRLFCLEQRLRTCQDYVNLGVDETLIDVTIANPRLKYHRTSMFARLDLHLYKNLGIQAEPAETPSEHAGDGYFMLRSPRHFPRQRPQLLTSVSMNPRQDKRSSSPRHIPLPRTVSLMPRSTSPNTKKRYPSEPRRTVSLSMVGEDVDQQYSTKSKRLFKAMLSLRKSKKDLSLHKFLDDN